MKHPLYIAALVTSLATLWIIVGVSIIEVLK